MKRSSVVATAGVAAALLTVRRARHQGAGAQRFHRRGGGGAQPRRQQPAEGRHRRPTASRYSMTFVQGVAGDGFYVTMGCGIKAEAKKIGNISVNIQGPTQFDATLQNPIISSVVASKPDALLIAPDDVSASQTPINQAIAAGIKVVLVTRRWGIRRGGLPDLVGQPGRRRRGVHCHQEARAERRQGARGQHQTRDQHHRPAHYGFANAAKADSKYTYVGVQYDQDSASVAAQVTSAAAEGPRHRRHLRHEPVLCRGRRDRGPPGRQVRNSEDRRLRRRS